MRTRYLHESVGRAFSLVVEALAQHENVLRVLASVSLGLKGSPRYRGRERVKVRGQANKHSALKYCWITAQGFHLARLAEPHQTHVANDTPV